MKHFTPTVGVEKLAESSIEMIATPYAEQSNYCKVYRERDPKNFGNALQRRS
ncbi:hypothetical protein [Bacteroidetes bacterium endosymbiont of Geopemphigus sp.]|uniref:hypothetical protein n=1 Tax=Bacteroidetes bacterium endosymbiont of Geopemphigus sp. TaxID=2047937 RepID=UPI0018A859F5|nr:hypothetical protein [Bacteroidetes bacterium endosymbiont of Geopemphigus sp.]